MVKVRISTITRRRGAQIPRRRRRRRIVSVRWRDVRFGAVRVVSGCMTTGIQWGQRQARLLTVLVGSPGPLGKTPSGTTDKPLFGHVFVDKSDLWEYGKVSKNAVQVSTQWRWTDLACRTLDYSPDIQPSVPSDEHTGIRLRPSSTRTSRTTSIRAFFGGCTRAETRTRHPFCKAHAASACKRSPNALCPEDE